MREEGRRTESETNDGGGGATRGCEKVHCWGESFFAEQMGVAGTLNALQQLLEAWTFDRPPGPSLGSNEPTEY
jgi:hypothetical protein